MLEVKPLAKLQMDVLFELFRDYATIGDKRGNGTYF
jgi:hypothetical protein